MRPAVIIGLGRVGIGRGITGMGELPNHMKAMQAAGFRIVGLVDPNPEVRDFARCAHPALAPAVAGALSEVSPQDGEVIAICTSPASHAATLAEALKRRPHVIVMEKPLAPDFDASVAVLADAEPSGIQILVNFHRRFDARHRRWRDAAPDTPRLVTARFGKGLWNYASHIVDLLLDWYGPVASVQALASVRPDGADPNLSFRCRMEAGFDAVLVGVDGVDYDQFEIDIYGTDDKIEMRGGGAMIRRCGTIEDLYHAGYVDLTDGESDTGTVDGFTELYAHIARGDTQRGCRLADAVANAAVLDAALASAELGGIAVEPRFRNSKGT